MSTKDARAVKSRKALMEAGIELLLQNSAASLSEIAAHAGVGRATLYRQFDSREQLIQEIALESLQIKEEIMSPYRSSEMNAIEYLEAIIKSFMPLADRFHFLLSLWNIAEEDPEVMAIYNRQLFELVALVERAKKEGSICLSLDSNWVVCLIDSLIYSGWWMMSSMGMSAESAAEHTLKALTSGLAPVNKS